MILTMECPDNFYFLNISFVDQNKSKTVTRSFTKCELWKRISTSIMEDFVGFPADKIDDTMTVTDD